MWTEADINAIALWWRFVYLIGWDSSLDRELADEMLLYCKEYPEFNHINFIKIVFMG